jgi:hypothetical protein
MLGLFEPDQRANLDVMDRRPVPIDPSETGVSESPGRG